jgi:hypothetical protein
MTKELWRQHQPAPKTDEVVCAHNFFRRKGTKPILQATVPCRVYGLEIVGACESTDFILLFYQGRHARRYALR